jgi:hypothetical protein
MTLRLIDGGSSPPQRLGLADYVWIDDSGTMRSKTRVIPVGVDTAGDPIPLIERWTTHEGSRVVLLSPCHYLPDPLRPQPSFITLCEVRDEDDTCRSSNQRSVLRQALGPDDSIWWGFRQGYLLDPMFSEPPGKASSKDYFLVAERHLGACMDAGLMIHSADFDDVSFKIGPRGMPQSVDPESPTALVAADHLWMARYLLKKVAREFGLVPNFVRRRCSVFFSTETMRRRALFRTDLAESILRLGTRFSGRNQPWVPSLRAGVVTREEGFECLEDIGPPGNMDPYTMVLHWIETIRTET